MALSTGQKQGALVREYNSATMRDDKKFYFGDGQDVSLEWDNANSHLEIDGGDVVLNDDYKLYFGTDKNGYICYDETTNDVLGIADATSGLTYATMDVAVGGESGFAKGCVLVDLTSGAPYVNISDTTDAKWSGLSV